MSKKSEVQEIEILTPEQIQSLPDTVKENVVFLTENANAKDLAVLNPIVSTLLKIKSDADKLKFVSIDDKESIDAYKAVKSSIGKFNTKLKSSASTLKKDLKKPYQAVLDIEKTFKTISDETGESIRDTFKDYEEEVIRKREEAQRKKDEALQKQIDDAKQEAYAANEQNLKSTVYNKIKYELIAEPLVNQVNVMITTANEVTLKERLDILENKTNFGDLIALINFAILDVEVQAELRSYFANSVHNSVKLIKDKLESIKTAKALELENAKKESTPVEKLNDASEKIEQHFPSNGMPMPPGSTSNNIEVYDAESFNTLNDNEFIDYVLEKRQTLWLLVAGRIKVHGETEELMFLYNSLKP